MVKRSLIAGLAMATSLVFKFKFYQIKTFYGSLQNENHSKQVNMDEVLELLNQKFARSKRNAGTSLRRSTRNIKESLARSKRYNSGFKLYYNFSIPGSYFLMFLHR